PHPLAPHSFPTRRSSDLGDGRISYQDWSINGSVGSQQDGVNTWASTDMPETGLAIFGYNCNNPSSSSDDTYGQWWLDNCRRRTRSEEHTSELQSPYDLVC